MNDSLQYLLNEQSKLQKFMAKGVDWYDKATDDEFLFTMSYAMLEEVVEVIRELNWKPWKHKHELELDKIKEELIDVLHFWLTIANCLKMNSEEILSLYSKKNRKNRERKIQLRREHD